jgi:hypothetical protein
MVDKYSKLKATVTTNAMHTGEANNTKRLSVFNVYKMYEYALQTPEYGKLYAKAST